MDEIFLSELKSKLSGLDHLDHLVVLMATGKYRQILNFLRTSRAQVLGAEEKRAINAIFDVFLERLEAQKSKLTKRQLNTLAEIKKILILYELEANGGSDMAHLKVKIRAHVEAREPLANLIKKPFVSLVNRADRKLAYFSDDLMRAYREVLADMEKGDAAKVHYWQVIYFNALEKDDYFRRYALRDLESLLV